MVKKKLVAMALCAAMCVSICTPVSATELPGTPTEEVVTEVATSTDSAEELEQEEASQTDAEEETSEADFEWDGTTITRYYKSAKRVVIPKKCTAIGDGAFKYRRELESVVIPDSVQSIGKEAFYSCDALQEINIPDGVPVISKGMFEFCSELTEIVIPESVTLIEEEAFFSCSLLKKVTLSEGVKSIGQNSFTNTVLEAIKLPESLEKIEHGAFGNCDQIKELYIPANVSYIGDDMFYGKQGLKNIEVSTENKYYNSNDNCNAIVETATKKLLLGSENTKIPDGIKEIVSDAFNGSDIAQVDFPESLKKIGSCAFSGCGKLREIYIPEALTDIDNSAFRNCGSLSKITVSEENTEYRSEENSNAIIRRWDDGLYIGCKNTVIPKSVEKILNGAFEYCTMLSEITIPESVTWIEKYAFSECTSLEKLTLSDGLMFIEDCAFADCKSLKELHIPASVADITIDAFMRCSGLEKITVDDNNLYYRDENCNALIGSDYDESTEETREDVLFRGCSDTVIPKSVAIIGEFAFYGCKGMKKIDIPANVKQIDREAFSGCTALTKVTLPSTITSISYGTFDNCKSLKDINIPTSVTSIGKYAFEGCESLTKLVVPSSVTELEWPVFWECDNLTLYVNENSAVHQHAKKYYYKYVIMGKAPMAVTNLKAASAGKNKVKLTWTASSVADGYIVYAKRNNAKAAYIGMTSKTSYTDTQALDNAYNYYFVYPYVLDANGRRVLGKCPKYVYAKGVCLAVTNLKATSVKGGVKVTWTKSAGADGYLIYGKRGKDGKYGYIGMKTSNGATTFTDTKAKKDIFTFYWVFPYHYDKNGKRVVGPICAKYVYGKAK